MNQIIFTAVISSLCTGIIGFASFIFSNVYFKAIQRYKDLRGDTVSTLIFYKNILSNPIDLADIKDKKVPQNYILASDEIRKLASKWYSLTTLKPPCCILIPRNKKIKKIAKNLIGLSNSIIYPYNQKDRFMVKESIKMIEEISANLKIKIDI
ncbi:hypothetical protein [Paraclostridium bifermentans]|uniref:hypothetical protein n=1 Tax=Paraclostridium bifermentans TaxID=1490 RepID=UPI00242B5CF0|nr:hypothetical protein [Paraclostridium bifermentans]